MEWFKGKMGQIIALVSIIGTLAGFGYTGATYVNRIENLETKVKTFKGTEEAQTAIEERFAGIEVSVTAINKTIDESLLLWLREAEDSISVIEVSVGRLQSKVDTMPDLGPVEGNISIIKVDIGKIESDLNSLEKQLEKLEDKDVNPLTGL
jgi:chromosome segregation ATPase